MAEWPKWASPIIRAIIGDAAGPFGPDNPLPVDVVSGGGATPNAIHTSHKEVAAAGTAEKLVAASTPCEYVALSAYMTNTGIIAVGDSGVKAAADNTLRGDPLNAGETAVVAINDVSKIWVDATVNGEGVTYNYLVGAV